MANFLANEVITIILIVIGLIVIVSVILTMWKKVPQDKAAVVTGLRKRIITGGGGLVIPVLERVDYIGLNNIPLEVKTKEAMSSQGVPIMVVGIANIKVKNETTSILSAIEQFTGRNEAEIEQVIAVTANNMLSGKLREIISRLTVEEIFQDRERFAAQVQEVIAADLGEMGLEIKNFSICDLDDDNGYLKALGAKRIAEVKRDAEISVQLAAKETQIEVSKAKREGEAARIQAETEIAESVKQQAVQKFEYEREQQTAKAIADASYKIQESITLKEVTDTEMNAEVLKQQRLREVEAEKVQIDIAKELKRIELAQKKAERKKAELQETVIEPSLADQSKQKAQADAEKYRKIAEAEAQAEARRKQGLADAEIIKKMGEAEAEAIKAKGLAEAEAMEKKAEAYKMYNDAAMANMLIEVLPELADKIAAPLTQIEKIVVLDGGSGNEKSGVANVAGNVTGVMTQVFETVKEVTGIDLKDVVKGQTYDAKVNKNITINGDAMEALTKHTESPQL